MLSIEERISEAASYLPGDIAIIVLSDVDKRISDWRASGGQEDSSYMEQQARYVENVAKVYKKKHGQC